MSVGLILNLLIKLNSSMLSSPEAHMILFYKFTKFCYEPKRI